MTRAVDLLLQRADSFDADARYLEQRKPTSLKPNRDSELITFYRAVAAEFRNVARDAEDLTEKEIEHG